MFDAASTDYIGQQEKWTIDGNRCVLITCSVVRLFVTQIRLRYHAPVVLEAPPCRMSLFGAY